MARSGCARPLKTIRFFSVVRFIPVTRRDSSLSWSASGEGSFGGAGQKSDPHPGHHQPRGHCLGRLLLFTRRSRGLGLRRAGPLRLRPALEVALRGAADGQRAGRHVAAYDGAAGGARAVADLDRCDEGVVGAGLGVAPDDGAVLGHAVVVGEDRAGPDVGALADLGVADVGQVRHLGAVADRGVLGLDERADLALHPELRAGPEVGERPDRGAGRR